MPKNYKVLNTTSQGDVLLVNMNDIVINRGYQRELSPGQVKKIRAGFNWAYFGIPTLWPVEDNMFECLDGQHRLDILPELFPDGKYENGKPVKLMGLVPPKHVKKHEVFCGINQSGTRRALSPNEIFKANLFGGERIEVAIRNILLEYDIELQFTRGRAAVGVSKSAAGFKSVYLACGSNQRFRDAVGLLCTCFSRPDGGAVEATALKSDFLRGYAQYLQGCAYKFDTVEAALLKANFSSDDIVKKAQEARQASRYAMLNEIANLLHNLVAKYRPGARCRRKAA